MERNPSPMDRREFLKTTAAGIAASGAIPAIARAAEEAAAPKVDDSKLIRRNEKADGSYRRLGRTNFNCSRIVAGWMREKSVLRRTLANGVNYVDTARGYGEYEVELVDLLKSMRDQLWVTSKATGIAGYNTLDNEVQKLYREAMTKFLGDEVTIAVDKKERKVKTATAERATFLGLHQECVKKMKATGQAPDWRPVGHRIASMYERMLDESLGRMKIEYVDTYMMHGIEIPWIFQCTELWDVYEKAHKAGKAKHFGFSTHANQKDVLAAAVEANEKGPWKIDLIMPGVNPMSYLDYKPELQALKKQDVGIIAMKTKGIVRRAEGKREEKLAEVADGKKLNEWERAKTYMLHATDDCIDACIAAMDKMDQVDRTLSLPKIELAAAARKELEAIVRLEMAGSCRLCGNCTTICPEDIVVADILRYHAYVREYDDRELATTLYRELGYEPDKRCSSCGDCIAVCPERIDLIRAVNELAAEMA